MEFSWLLLVLAVAIFVSSIVLVIVCLNCRNSGPQVSIRQASEIYMPSTDFRVIHSAQPTTDVSVRSPSTLLSPFPHSSDPGTQRRQRSVTPTETESIPSYENSPDVPYVNPGSYTDPDYILVLADGDAPPNNPPSRASTHSSDTQHDYENVVNKEEEDKEEDDDDEDEDDGTGDYLNVEVLHTATTPEESSDDDDGNYVNQPPLMMS